MLTSSDLRSIAEERKILHANHPWMCRILSKDYWYIGLMGENEFSKEFGIAMDLSLRPKGDGGIDFYTPAGTIDVKTARHPQVLLREAYKKKADIIVLAWYDETNDVASLIGWEYDYIICQQPIKKSSYGVFNHRMPRELLRPISELHEIIERAW